MPSVNNNRPSRKKTIPGIPSAGRSDRPLNKSSLASGKAKITKKTGKRLTLKSKDQKTEWLFVPKRGSYVTKNQRKA